MNLHKDKFISPTIYQELRGLEVKRNGKVEHSDNTHDDQIFSYLMAIYVWYDGKNLREIYGVDKGAIKTEDDVDDVLEMESANDSVDITKQLAAVNRTPDSAEDKLDAQLAEMKKAQGILYSDFIKKQRKEELTQLAELLKNPVNRQAYANKYKISVDSVSLEDGTTFDDNGLQTLPDSLFTDFNKDEEEMVASSIYNSLNSIMNSQDQVDDSIH